MSLQQEVVVDMQEELRQLVKISANFRKKKGPRSKWPTEFQLRVLRLIEAGFSPTALSKKLNIPVQTYYHWRRVWKDSPKKSLGSMADNSFRKIAVNKNQNVLLAASRCIDFF